MMRQTVCVLLSVTFAWAQPARAGDTMKDALSFIPADAMGCLCVPSLQRFDASYQRAITTLGLQPFVPPPSDSIITLLRQKLPFAEGLDENGMFAVVIMPTENVFELWMKMAMIVPAKDPKSLLETMGAMPGEEGLWSVNVQGQPQHAAILGSRLVFSQMADVVKAFVASKEGLSKKLKPGELKSLESLDIALWLDTGRLLKMLKPQIDGFMAMAMAAQAGQNPLAAKQAELNKKQVDMYVEGMSSLGLGLRYGDAGLKLRFAMTARPGSKFGEQIQTRNTTDSLLRGLPGEDYMVVFGQIMDPEQVKASVDDLDDYFSIADDVEEVDQEKLGRLKGLLKEWLPLMTGFRGSLGTVTPGEFGVFTASVIVETTDSRRWLENLDKAVGFAKDLAVGEAIDADIQQVADAFSFDSEGEELSGAKVAHLKFDLSKIEELDEEDVEEMSGVIGKDGLLLRLAAVDPRTVVVGFGGGSSRMARLLDLAKRNDAALDNDPGIKKVAAQMAKQRQSVMYAAVDEVFAGIHNAQQALDEEPLPVQMPPLDAPLAFTGSGGDGWMQLDIFMPTELLVAGKDAIMKMMGTGGAPPAGETEPKEPAATPGG